MIILLLVKFLQVLKSQDLILSDENIDFENFGTLENGTSNSNDDYAALTFFVSHHES